MKGAPNHPKRFGSQAAVEKGSEREGVTVIVSIVFSRQRKIRDTRNYKHHKEVHACSNGILSVPKKRGYNAYTGSTCSELEGGANQYCKCNIVPNYQCRLTLSQQIHDQVETTSLNELVRA